ncbi:Tfp pilus tip-associated adhesin PilY1 [Desulfosalsimonas propionicica]|uniref:Tfp pilus tip-associated adhesin PilY1 n=1 Tax=Desulfosalsimonas propionicica TaxID=332175 RepID=A0A7W0C7P1_9BACT|nr:PilC/PilY family type IV pilus protein [Desulfosalsimonas propionicica]MBA2880642.1 Tfp pilus tip-associated adhesin PilY1 [Desulfosalsimonas propionicica]
MGLLLFPNKKHTGIITASILFFVLTAIAPVVNADECVFDYLADIPLDTQEQAGPGLIMFLLDDSGSMDWSMMMTDDYADSSGLYHGYGYVFDDPGDIYSYSWPPLDVDRRMEWVTQWSETNKMYYNPGVTYEPWPRWHELSVTDTPAWTDPLPDTPAYDMDPDNPRSLPTSDDYTLNMNETYYDFGEGISTADILVAGGVIVDNSNETAGMVAVDDTEPGFSYTRESGWNNYDNEDFYNGNYQNINLNGGAVSATWQFDVEDSGEYEVVASFSINTNRTDSAEYTIDHSGGTTTVTRSQHGPGVTQQWESLGTYDFDAGSNAAQITLNCAGTTSNDYVAVDAIRLEPTFTVSDPNVLFAAGSGWSFAENGEQYGEDYLYTDDGSGNYTATWTANNLDSSESYTVYARWTGGGDSRLENVEYTVYDDGTEKASASVNQKENHGEWVQIASGIEFNGSGIVKIDQEADNSGMCADGVAFMPSSGPSPINLVRAHYYVQADDGTMYLVNLDGEIEYWRINDANDNMKVDSVYELEKASDPPSEIVTGRSYNEERVNFGNWYSFYRKRELTAKNAVANVIDDVQGVYIGILTIHKRLEQHALPIQVDLDGTLYEEAESLLGSLYTLDSSGGTPLRTGLKQLGEYFSGSGGGLRPSSISSMPAYVSGYMSEDSYPYFTEDKGGACQQAFSIAMTDGYWNGSNPSIGNEDGNDDTDFDGDPFGDSYYNTLADVAMKYYEDDLNPDLSDVVPTRNWDQAAHQHMITYSVSFGVTGTIDRSVYPECGRGGSCPYWPNPGDSEQNKIDDLYHAAVNGRGKYINASNPQELIDAMGEMMEDIESRLGSAASVATNSVQRTVGTTIYQGIYNTDNWHGDVMAKEVELESGSVGSTIWSASLELEEVSWDSREIITYDGTSGVPFRYGQSGVPYEENLVNYLRGDPSNNVSNGGTYRTRASKLGDVVHSSPEYYNGVVYVGANNGMLHVFDAETGEEKFAYIPKILIDKGSLPGLASTDYSHQFYVDGAPFVRKISDTTTLLVGGLRKGGKGYFGLNVSDSDAISEVSAADLVKWEYAADSNGDGVVDDSDLGYSYSSGYIVKTRAAGWVVIFGNGYGSENESAVLYILDVDDETGALLSVTKIDTGAVGCNGLSSPAITDVNSDGYADYVYAGDLKGNLWKFDLTDTNGDDLYEISDWKIAYGTETNPEPLIKVSNDSGGQPITVEPDVMRMGCEPGQEGYFVVFGTGQYIAMTDFENTDQQSFYGVWDWQDAWPEDEQASRYLGEFTATAANPVLSNAPDNADSLTLLEQTASAAGSDWRMFSDNSISYFTPTEGDIDSETDHAGWYFNLLDERARVIRDPSLRSGSARDSGIVNFISSIPSESPCDAGGYSWLYRVSACSGGRSNNPQFDTTGDNKVNKDDDAEKSGKSFDQMIYTPTSIGDMDYLTDSTGDIQEEASSERPEGMVYWRILQ